MVMKQIQKIRRQVREMTLTVRLVLQDRYLGWRWRYVGWAEQSIRRWKAAGCPRQFTPQQAIKRYYAWYCWKLLAINLVMLFGLWFVVVIYYLLGWR